NVYRKGSDGQNGPMEQAKCLSGGAPMDKNTQGNRKNVYRKGHDGLFYPHHDFSACSGNERASLLPAPRYPPLNEKRNS
ncbi:hypothetical protein, partial [Neobacillus drentensis]|uniref:hypothetical protein n=1 Tax=Neobacillus drentensis TaxID=220684 RepID=UPI002FFED9D0